LAATIFVVRRRCVVEFSSGKHLVSTLRCNYLSVATVLADQQVGGTPDVEVGDHSGSSRSAASSPSAINFGTAHRVLNAAEITTPGQLWAANEDSPLGP
jgi:hypothetical protein